MAAQAPNLAVGEFGAVSAGLAAIDLPPSRFRVFLKSLELWLPVGILAIMVFFCFIWPELYHVPNPSNGNLLNANLPVFAPHHILGTDTLGNDEMAEILYGGRVSLEVGVGVALIGIIVGGSLGTFAGYKGGMIEAVVMRILDMFLAFPSLVLAITIVTYLGQSEMHVIWAISFFAVPAVARLARSTTLRLREQTFIVASRLSGAGDTRILFRHIAPNVLPQLMTLSLLGIAISIITEAALSFLGLGVPAQTPSWGKMIANGQIFLSSSPNLVLVPSAFLFVTVMSLNLTGDALRARWGVQ